MLYVGESSTSQAIGDVGSVDRNENAANVDHAMQQVVFDFNAELISKNGKKIFANPQYEHKNNYWKMGFRAGREVVEPTRLFIEKWIQEIK